MTMLEYPQRLSSLVFFIALSVPIVSAAGSSDEDIANARESFLNCQMEHLQAINEQYADVREAALGLTELCLDEYQALNKMMARQNYDTSNERRMFTIEKNSRMLQIEASLPLVNDSR